ncbi:hypothetical protein BHM03_00059489 [Ensete ventricosum]|nr:hypothetical protein BHM03_00059489 [Ensete ventricosum]
MGLVAPWYRRGGTSVESSIPCSHGGTTLVVKGVEEVENAKANSKYQDKAEGQRSRNFIRPPSNLAFSTTKRMGEVEYSNSLTYPAEELCISSFDYSTTTAGSGWEPKGRVAAKAEDSTKWRRCSVYSGFDEEVEGISGADRSPYKASAGAISHRFNAADGESFAQDI